MSFISEFRTFIARGNVMDLAVGVIIGGAFGTIVSSFTNDIIMPVIGAVFGNVDFSEQFLTLKPAPDGTEDFATLAAAKEAGAVTLNYGAFASAILNFLIVAFAIFLMVKSINKIRERYEKKEEEAAAGPTQEELLAEIRDLLKERTV